MRMATPTLADNIYNKTRWQGSPINQLSEEGDKLLIATRPCGSSIHTRKNMGPPMVLGTGELPNHPQVLTENYGDQHENRSQSGEGVPQVIRFMVREHTQIWKLTNQGYFQDKALCSEETAGNRISIEPCKDVRCKGESPNKSGEGNQRKPVSESIRTFFFLLCKTRT